MLGVEIEGSDQAIVAIQQYPERTTRAMVRAMNRGIASGQTLMASLIAKDLGLKVSDVKTAMPVTPATFGRPIARFGASLKRIPLIKFGARGPEPSRGRGTGVRYRMAGGRGHIPSAFIATMRSGHRGVFKRAGPARLPINELHGPSLGHVFRKFRPQGVARVQEMFEKNFAHEMKRLGDTGEAAAGASGSD